MNVTISTRTREALRNLFTILNIEGDTFDERLFALASMAFLGHAQVEKRKSVLRHAPRGAGRQDRKKIEVKLATVESARQLFFRTYPFLEWQSWDWWLNDMVETLWDHIRDIEAEEGLNSGSSKEE